MKKFFLFMAIVGMLLPSLVLAAVFRSEENVAQNEVVSGNMYLFGNSPVMSGTVKGDLGIFGRNAVVTGNVEQDLFIAGANVNVTGHIGGDVRAFGGEIVLDGAVDGEVLAYGGNVKIGPHAQIKGDVNSSGGTVMVDPAAKVMGKENIAQGRAEERRAMTERTDHFEGLLTAGFWIGKIVGVVAIIIVALILLGLYPKFLQQSADMGTQKNNFWPSFGLGLLLIIVTPIAALLSFITGVGFLLGFILLFGYILMILMSVVFAGVLCGGLLYRWIGKPKKFNLTWWWLIIGVLGLHVLMLIPILGWLVGAVFFFLACGTLVRTKWNFLR